MLPVCQALIASFAFPTFAVTGPAGVLSTIPPSAPGSVQVLDLPDRPYPDLLLSDPELAAALLLAPGGPGDRKTLPQGIDSAVLGARIAARVQGLLPAGTDAPVVYLSAADQRGVQAVGHGGTVLLVLPADRTPDPEEMASAAAETLVASSLTTAAPVGELGEPLVALGEALGRGGALALASLPPSLRPVSGWLEVAAARAALEDFTARMLDAQTGWAARRVALLAAGRPGGASPALSHAAGALLECLGAPGGLAARPRELLDAWSRYEGKECPRMPRVLRRALADPTRAGCPPPERRAETEAVAAAARARVVEAGPLDTLPSTGLSGAQVQQLAARLRAMGGSGLCPWLRGFQVPPLALTGCREDEAATGLLFSRPLPGRGFEVVWLGRDGSQASLLVWPRWVLSPALCSRGTSLCFIDPRGVWRVALDAGLAPVLVRAGAFRSLAPGPDGVRLAAARWPEAETLVVNDDGSAVLIGAAGHAGLAWIDREVLAVASGSRVGLFSATGEGRADVVSTVGATAMTARAGTLYLAESGPSGPTITRVDLGTGQRERLTEAPGAVSSLGEAPDGSLVMVTSGGLWRWRRGEIAQRFGDGLSVGP